MKILIIYGTTEGQTRKIARFMEDILQEKGYQVAISDATDEPPTPEIYDLTIIGSSIHMHSYQRSIDHYVRENIELLNKKPSAFYSVSLAAASKIKEEHEEAQEIMDTFLEKTEWKPQHTSHVAGALKYSKYNYLTKLIMRMIAKKEGASADVTEDHEYTDWDKVKDFTLDLVQ